MIHPIRLLPAAQQDIQDALQHTWRQFGARKYGDYVLLIREALDLIATDPDGVRCRRRPEIHAQARTLHLRRPGRAARHFLLFRLTDDGTVEVARMLYDGMELSRHLPDAYRADADADS
ncbi:MAG: type II toxin-antitoxin system RelE/ParE family toxin [Phycisphaerales bacterium]|nr:type II toxin-antitoxin system RelE/ParE family toxin [Phycisphaerales bacterium]